MPGIPEVLNNTLDISDQGARAQSQIYTAQQGSCPKQMEMEWTLDLRELDHWQTPQADGTQVHSTREKRVMAGDEDWESQTLGC